MQYVLRCCLGSIDCVTKAVGFVVFHDLFQKQVSTGTCDGCTFYFLWESVEACPLCTEHDFHEIEGACKRISGKGQTV